MPAVAVGPSRSASIIRGSAASVGSAGGGNDSTRASAHGIIDVSFGKFSTNGSSAVLPSPYPPQSQYEMLESGNQFENSEGLSREFSLQSVKPPIRPPPPGIPVARYRAKLEECADLHRQLQDMMLELQITREQLKGSLDDCSKLSMEIMRLRDVLNMTTSELQLQRSRVDELQWENKQLRGEVRAGKGANGTSPGGRKKGLASRAEITPRENLTGTHGWSRASATMRPYSTNFIGSNIAPSSAVLHSNTSSSAQSLVRADTFNVSGGIVAYVTECFRSDILPHLELLHSLCDVGHLIAVDPPITYAQLNVLQRVVAESKKALGSNNSVHPKKISLRLNSRPLSSSLPSSIYPYWVNRVELLSFRSENWHTTIGLVLQMIHILPSVRCVEIFALSGDSIMQRLAETLLMELHVKSLSLPEMCLTDEGISALFALIARRARKVRNNENVGGMMSSSPSTGCLVQSMDEVSLATSVATATTVAEANTTSAIDDEASLLEVRCLDFSRCTIRYPTTLFHAFQGPMVEVLVLTGCSDLCDVHLPDILEACPQLHTLDLSGNNGLTTACVQHISSHKNIKVLRLENCPGIRRLELTRVEVLFSSLAYVTTLYAPELRRLPVPLTHANVLFDFYAPKLTEITLKGIVVDRGTLSVFIPNATDSEDERCVSTSRISDPGDVLSDKSCREQASCAVAQLLLVGFIDCTIASSSELELFLKHQKQMQRLSLHGSRGVADVHVVQLPSTLLELDVGAVAQLTGRSISAISVCLPHLIKLNLKNAGITIQNNDVHRLRALVNLEVLNLLEMPQLETEVVVAVAKALSKLLVLYHETALVETDPAATPLRLGRSDEEDVMRYDINNCAFELLQLSNETSLALWMEKQLPKPAQLLPSPPSTTCPKDVGNFLANTTHYYGVTHQRLSPYGTCSVDFMEAIPSTISVVGDASLQKPKLDVLTFPGLSGDAMVHSHSTAEVHKMNNNNNNNDDDDDYDNNALRQECLKTSELLEAVMGEKSRLAIEKTPLGPWDDADIVAVHRQQSGC